MKKISAFMLSMVLILTFAACTMEPTVKEPTLKETSTDPEFLTAMWDDYISDCSFTIANGPYSWNNINDIKSSSDICNYLFLKMQRNKDFTDIENADLGDPNKPFSIKINKLEEYSEKYFNEVYDFKALNSYNCYYDSETDSVYFSPHNLENIPSVKYNEPDEFPNNVLTEIEVYDNNTVIAKVKTPYWLAAQNGEEQFYEKIIKLTKREDGSYYFNSVTAKLPKLDTFTFNGDYDTVPQSEDYLTYSNMGIDSNNNAMITRKTDKDFVFKRVDIKTGKTVENISFPLTSKDTSYNVLRKGDNFTIIESTMSPDGQEVLSNSIWWLGIGQKEKNNVTVPDDCYYIYNVSSDFKKIAYSKTDNKGVYIYDVDSKESILLKETEPTLPTDQTDPSWIMGITSYGEVEFVNNNKSLFLTKYGYESTMGYLLYHLETGESTFYPLTASWGGQPFISEYGAYLGNVYPEGSDEVSQFFINFENGEQEESPMLISPEGGSGYYIHPQRYIPLAISSKELVNDGSLVTFNISLFDSKTREVKDTGVTITSPDAGSPLFLFTNEKGDIYGYNPFLMDDTAILIENKN